MKKKSTLSILISFIAIVLLISFSGLHDENTSIGQAFQNLLSLFQQTPANQEHTTQDDSILQTVSAASQSQYTAAARATKKPSKPKATATPKTSATPNPAAALKKNGSYTSKDEVALYLHSYGTLPRNFITKKEALELGWDNTVNYVGDVAKGMSIGGDRFGNFEGKLPKEKGRQYYECDIDYSGKKRGSKRIVYSNDGLIYYTDDHYNSFTLLYTKEGGQ